jgi:hypothetical protein
MSNLSEKEKKKMEKNKISQSLRIFKERRDDLLHEDTAAFELNVQRFLEFCDQDELIRPVVESIEKGYQINAEDWWQHISSEREISFPSNMDEDLALRYSILRSVAKNPHHIFSFGFAVGKTKGREGIDVFRSMVIRSLASELSDRIAKAADLATPEARALQAVPLSRIPSATETRIFLSHKSADKPVVMRYYTALKELGFEPWLDQPDMPAGTNLERGILDGFEKSCAAVFFITENFKDESYLATEVDYAVAQKRKKGKKFSIITLRYPNASPVPGLLTPYIYKDVNNDLEGFHELVRALPIELGQIRWRKDVV